jgi:MFS family permease
VIKWNKNKNGTLYLYAISFLISAVWGLLIPTIPIHAFHLGATQLELGLIGGAAPLTYAIFTIALGRLWGRGSRKKPIVAFFLLYSAVCLLYFYVKSPLEMILLRLFEGFSWSLFWPPVEVLVTKEKPEGEQGVVSVFGVSWSSGGILGAFLSSFALQLKNIADVFLAVAVLPFCLAFTSMLMIKDETDVGAVKKKVKTSLKKTVSLKTAWTLTFLYASCQGMVLALYPAYAEIKLMPDFAIGLTIFLLMTGRTLAFVFFNKIKGFSASKIGSILLVFGSLPLAFTTDVKIVFPCSIAFGFGAGLLYSVSFNEVMKGDAETRGRRAGVFEGIIGIGNISPVAGGYLAEILLNAPYILNSAIAALVFTALVLKSTGKKRKK